ncbi:MAG: IclR family transcriptional regulator [Acidobacteriota bacterium]
MTEKAKKPTYQVKVIGKTFRILECLVQQAMGPTEISKKVEMHVSTVYRILSNLQQAGYVVQSRPNGTFALSLKVLKLSDAALRQLDFRKETFPFLKALSERTRETVHMTVLEGTEVVYIEKCESSEPVAVHSRIGGRAPLHCTAVGKAILAFLPEQAREELLGRIELKKFTSNTITSRGALKRELSAVQRQAYAMDDEEYREGIRCMGAPIFDYKGDVIAAFSITIPAARFGHKRVSELALLVQDTSRKISGQLGYHEQETH